MNLMYQQMLDDSQPSFTNPYESLAGLSTTGSSQIPEFNVETFLDWQLYVKGSHSYFLRLHFFFDFIHQSLPILYESRFFDELNLKPQSRPLLALQYAVGALGASLSPSHEQTQQKYYKESRKYLEMCEIEEDEAEFANLHTFQALLLLLRYEIMASKITRAWMTLGRAIRLASVLNLHKMDSMMPVEEIVAGLHVNLPSTTDAVVLEERRRAFWCLFILETYVRTRSGMPCQLGQSYSFEMNLPSPGPLTLEFEAIEMPFLRNMNITYGELSSYAACVIMVDLAIKCYEHAEDRGIESQVQGFWIRPHQIDTRQLY
ncbi:hypothetical protein QQZ08_006111 [Neonectria magnoliae]|uniref:Xylanolytic transcriptional activator regulatory domain-containing protein n=1 Tax=Neonectria magnoliae TaxID=2732573 RepID=A0ABR1I312_9HYPO